MANQTQVASTIFQFGYHGVNITCNKDPDDILIDDWGMNVLTHAGESWMSFGQL